MFAEYDKRNREINKEEKLKKKLSIEIDESTANVSTTSSKVSPNSIQSYQLPKHKYSNILKNSINGINTSSSKKEFQLSPIKHKNEMMVNDNKSETSNQCIVGNLITIDINKQFQSAILKLSNSILIGTNLTFNHLETMSINQIRKYLYQQLGCKLTYLEMLSINLKLLNIKQIKENIQNVDDETDSQDSSNTSNNKNIIQNEWNQIIFQPEYDIVIMKDLLKMYIKISNISKRNN